MSGSWDIAFAGFGVSSTGGCGAWSSTLLYKSPNWSVGFDLDANEVNGPSERKRPPRTTAVARDESAVTE